MKNIIALRGISNTGKTTTLRLFVDLVLTHFGDAAAIEYLRAKPVKLSDDIAVRIALHGKYIIGVESLGDFGGPTSRLKRSLEQFEKDGNDLIVCATRSKGTTRALVNDLATRGYRVDWIKQWPKATEQDRKARNEQQATTLLKKLIALASQ